MLVSWLVYSRTVKMETICYSETSVDFQQSADCYIPEEITCVLVGLLSYREDGDDMLLRNIY
jgi:hypothetical protein